jgi:hypothetical protein
MQRCGGLAAASQRACTEAALETDGFDRSAAGLPLQVSVDLLTKPPFNPSTPQLAKALQEASTSWTFNSFDLDDLTGGLGFPKP